MDDNINRIKESFSGHRKESKIAFALGGVLAFALALSAIISIILLIFPVVEIEVSGDSRYTYTEIIEASGVKKGARLYYVNEGKAERKTLEKLSYLENVKVNSYFPNRVKIEIKEFDDIYIVLHERGYCYVNGSFEILEIAECVPSVEELDCIFVRLEKKLDGDIGAAYEGEDADRAKELIGCLKEYGFYQHLNIVDVSQKYDVSFVAEKKYQFVIGAMSDVEEKLDVSFKVCFSDGFNREDSCIINSSDKKRVILRYVSDEIIREEFDFCEN